MGNVWSTALFFRLNLHHFLLTQHTLYITFFGNRNDYIMIDVIYQGGGPLYLGGGSLKKNVPLRGGLRVFGVTKYYHLSLNSNLSLFRNYYRLHRKIWGFFNKSTCIMESHGLPGVAALKIITKHLKTLLFEVHINLKIKHEAKKICHQYKLFLNTNIILFEDKIVLQIQKYFLFCCKSV